MSVHSLIYFIFFLLFLIISAFLSSFGFINFSYFPLIALLLCSPLTPHTSYVCLCVCLPVCVSVCLSAIHNNFTYLESTETSSCTMSYLVHSSILAISSYRDNIILLMEHNSPSLLSSSSST